MTKYLINNQCTGCGTCALVCPAKIITVENGIPSIAEEFEDRCIQCGQCTAYCPEKANSLVGIRQDNIDLEKAPLFRSSDTQRLVDLLKNRRSYRTFSKLPVPQKTIEQIVEVANYYPSARNVRPVRWIVINNPEKVKELSSLVAQWFIKQAIQHPANAKLASLKKRYEQGDDFVFRQATGVAFMVTSKTEVDWGLTDSAMACLYFNLAAEAFDIGCTIAGYAILVARLEAEVQKFLGLSENEIVQSGLFYGRKTLRSFRIPARPEPKVTFL